MADLASIHDTIDRMAAANDQADLSGLADVLGALMRVSREGSEQREELDALLDHLYAAWQVLEEPQITRWEAVMEPRQPYADLREEFRDLIDMDLWWSRGRFHAVASAVSGCHDVVPADTCAKAAMPEGSTYAQLSETLHGYLDECGKRGDKPGPPWPWAST